jgi:hypothetical protein
MKSIRESMVLSGEKRGVCPAEQSADNNIANLEGEV